LQHEDITDVEDFDLDTLLEAEHEWARFNRLHKMYEPGPYSIEKYPRHREIFAAGRDYRHRCFMGGNGTGKTYGMGGYETALHLTGLYPDWWTEENGFLRFDHPIDARACGDTRETCRDIIQRVMLGDFAKLGMEEFGTGIIPKHLLGKPKIVQNTNGAVDFVPDAWRDAVDPATQTITVEILMSEGPDPTVEATLNGHTVIYTPSSADAVPCR